MAGIFPNQFSTDSVDRLNHKWMVLLMLLLSLAAFIIPLHPSYHQGLSPETVTVISESKPESKQSGYKSDDIAMNLDINCWCPAQFTLSYVVYTNTFCKNAFLSALKGNNDTAAKTLDFDYNIPLPMGKDRGEPLSQVLKDYFKAVQKEKEKDSERVKVKSCVQSLVTFQTPLMLLVIAVVLVVPHAVWAFLSECCSPVNLAMTLASVAQASSLDTANRKQIFSAISSGMSSVKCSSKTASILYLVKKLLAVVVVIALLLAVSLHALSEIQQVEQQLEEVSPLSVTQKGPSSEDVNVQHKTSKTPADLIDQMKIFSCEFEIRRLQNIQTYQVQCIATFGSDKTGQNQAEQPKQPWTTHTVTTKSTSREKNLLQFETTIFQIVTSLLAIVAVANVLSLFGWLYRLMSISARNAVRLSGYAAMDTVLLIHMARIHCGPHVAPMLAQGSAEFSKVDENEMVEGT